MYSACICLIVVIVLIIILSLCVGCSSYVPQWYQDTMNPYYTPLKELPIVKNNIDPKKVCIFMVATSDISDYAKYSGEINDKYAKRHGYEFRVFDKNLTPDLPINFSKIQATLNLMNEKENGKTKFDYIIHIDADAIFHNQDYPITNIIAKYLTPPISFIASEDCYDKNICSKPNKMNSGVFIVKNNIFGKSVMNLWLDSSRGKCKKYTKMFPNCQLVFENCVRKPLFFTIKIIPYNALNGKDGLLISHMMQGTSRERIDQMKSVYKDNFNPQRMKVFN